MSRRVSGAKSSSSRPGVVSSKLSSKQPLLSLDAQLAEIDELKTQEEIEARTKKIRDDLANEWNKGKEHRDINKIDILMAVSKVG